MAKWYKRPLASHEDYGHIRGQFEELFMQLHGPAEMMLIIDQEPGRSGHLHARLPSADLASALEMTPGDPPSGKACALLGHAKEIQTFFATAPNDRTI